MVNNSLNLYRNKDSKGRVMGLYVEWPGKYLKKRSHVAIIPKTFQAEERSMGWPHRLECVWDEDL